MSQYGAIEAGGTKWICGVGTSPDDLQTVQIPTRKPPDTIAAALEFFTGRTLDSLGIGCFGPVDLNRASKTYGYITSTPKPGWQYTDVAGAFRKALGVPVAFDTDVNAALLGELRWGAARGLTDCIYLTVGTGVGGGALAGGHLVHGAMHPEMGHIRVPHDIAADPFPGSCPFHGDCFEGLASGPSIERRWGTPAELLPPRHEAWGIEARYLALAAANFLFTLSPQRIILGGGVMRQAHLFPLIRAELRNILNGYIDLRGDFVVPPALGTRSGVLGALALAQSAV